jgi:GNAT superfamily N-acetyltransferase
MRLSVEQHLSPVASTLLYEIYVQAFDPLRTRAAARHVLSAAEFEAEMLDHRIDKYVIWNESNTPIALTTLASDPAAVPWISSDYYATRFAEQVDRGCFYYLGYTLVRPDYQAAGITGRMLAEVVRRLVAARAVCGFDVSRHNDGMHHIGASVSRLGRSVAVRVDAADVQTYYIADFRGRAA